MLKNVQLKIILIFSILGIVLIGGLGSIFIYDLQNINTETIMQGEQAIQEYQVLISTQVQNMKMITIILISFLIHK